MSSLNLKPNPRGGTAKKITSSPYNKNLLRQLKKRKSKRPENPKPNDCVECSSWSFRKTEEKCLLGSKSDTPSESDTELAIPLADDATEEDKEQDAGCTVLVVSLKTTMEETG